MPKQVVITALAELGLEEVIEYLTSEWSIKTANDFIKRYRQVYKHLALNSGIYTFVDQNTKVCSYKTQYFVFYRN